MRMVPRRKRMLTADWVGMLPRLMEHERLAMAGIEANAREKKVLESTPVRGVLSIVALTLVGGWDLLEGCS